MKLLSGAAGICNPQDGLESGYYHATSQNWFLRSLLRTKSYFLLHYNLGESTAEF